jgi:hypothetical protein
MASAKVEIIYEAEASSLKATVNEVIKANDAIVTDTKETTKEVSDEYKKIGASASAAFGGTQVKAALDQLNKESDKLTANLKELQKEQILLVGSGNKLTKSYQDNIKAQAALKSQISQVNQEQAELNRTFGQTEEKQKTLTGQLRGLKQELALLEEQGKDNTDEFNKLLFTAAKLEDQIGDTRERVRVLASDTFKFDAAVGATQALASGFEVAQGAAALFGSEGKELQEVIAKTTAVTAIANGVNDLANQITGQGPLKLALYAAGQKAVAVATAISTGAISAFRVALAATGIGLFITGVALLVTKLQDAAANQASLNRSLELSKAAAENSKKAIEELRNAQLDSATRTLIATGQLSQAEADRLESIKGIRKQVDENINVELAAQAKLIVEKQKLEQRLAVFKDAVDGDVIRKQRKNIQDQIDNQEAEIKKSQENIRQIRQAGLLSEAQFNQALRSEESAKDRDEAQKLADDRKKAADDAAKAEIEARNAAREKLRQLELEALASQLDEREKILSDSNTKIAELEATFAEAKFAKGSEQERQLQTSINLIKEDATKQIAEIDKKAAEDKAARDKEAAEKLAAETLRIRVQGLNDEISLLKAAEINEGTSLDRRIKLIEKDGEKRIAEAEGNAATIKLINAQTEEAIRDERKKSTDEAIDQAFEIASASADALDSILKFQSQLTENRIAEIQSTSEKELEAINSSLESEVVKANKREALEKRTQSKIAAEKQKQARQEKALNIFRATIDTAASIVKTGAQLGYPAALPFQILAGIVGAANIAAIAAQPLPKFKKGGMVGGRSHEAGGTLIEAERGEYVVNKNSVMRNRRELDAINTSSAAFKRLIDERYVRPAILSYAMNNKRDGITVNASLNSKSMEKELKGLRKDMRNKNTIVNINGGDSRYTWQ